MIFKHLHFLYGQENSFYLSNSTKTLKPASNFEKEFAG